MNLILNPPPTCPILPRLQEIREPWIKGEIVVPQDYVGAVIQLIVRSVACRKT